jgi:hypothetical protein
LPAELQTASLIVAAVSRFADDPDAAGAFVVFLSSPAARHCLTVSGLDPCPEKEADR